MPSIDRWNATWSELGVVASSTQSVLFEDVTARYREPHRHYHILQHLDECFAHLSEVRELAEHPAEVELALWFHDAIYEVKRSDNEERSAQWARASALAAGVPAAAAERVFRADHVHAPRGRACGHRRRGIDRHRSFHPGRLSRPLRRVRASDPRRVCMGARLRLRRKRAEVLGEFLARSSIFCTPAFIGRYEQSARANIQRSLARLR